MRVAIVYHTLSGTTRRVAELLAERLGEGAALIPVRDRLQYSTLTAYTAGAPRAMRGEVAEVEPAAIEVGGYDVIAVGSPVWAFAPTPAANGAVAGLRGIAGKEAVVFIVSAGSPGEAAGRLGAALEARGARVRGAVAFDRKDVGNGALLDELADLVTRPPSGG